MFLTLMLLWVLFNGRLTWEIVAFGAAVSALITLFAGRCLGYSPKKALAALKRLWRARAYPAALIREIVKSNIALVKLVWQPHIEVKPRLVSFRTPVKSPLARELLSNSITLTPGTITASLEGDELKVHCLDESFSDGIEDCVFQRLLAAAEADERSADTEGGKDGRH